MMKVKYFSALILLLVTITGVYAQTPAITGFSPSSGQVGTLITVTGTNLSNPTEVTVGGKPAIAVSSSATKLVVMVMPGAANGGITVTNASGTGNAPAGFNVKPPVYPQFKQLIKVTNTGSIGKAQQGASVAVSTDGNTAVVGGTHDNTYKGALWVYAKTNNNWTQQAKLTGTGMVGNAFLGRSAAISADGNTIVAGGNEDNNGKGAVWVFIRTGSTWAQQGDKLVGSGNTGSHEPSFGTSVSISADGNTLIAGGPNDFNQVGAAWVFTRSGNTWAQAGNRLIGTGVQFSSNQGSAVAISADGKTAIVGGPSDNQATGAAWIFTRNGNNWTQQGSKITGSGGRFGSSVALNADGSTALIGAVNFGSNGGAWVFTRTAGTWSQQGSALIGLGENLNGQQQGASVALSADGNTALVGAPEDNNSEGASWVFARDGETWSQVGGKLKGTGGVLDSRQGWAVALNATGTMAIVGGRYDNTGVGAAWGFSASATPVVNGATPLAGPVGTVVTITGGNLLAHNGISIGGKPAVVISATNTKILAMVMPGAVNGAVSVSTGSGSVTAGNFTINATPYPNQVQGGTLVGAGNIGAGYQGYAVDISADGNTAIVGGYGDNGNQGAAWIYVRTGSIWKQQGSKLVGTGAVGNAMQGMAVAISGDGNTAVIGGKLDNNNAGAAWIFTRSGDTWTQQGNKLVGAGAVSAAQQGTSVDVSADGNTVFIGGPEDNNKTGAVWVFKRTGSTWAQQGNKLAGTNATGEMAGTSIAASADGTTIITGGFGDFGSAKTGAALVFVLNGNTWAQQGPKLTRTDVTGPYAGFGRSVAISADGNTAIVGGVGDNGFHGAAWVYTRTGSTWTQQGNKIVGSGSSMVGYLGFGVSLSADGNTALLGGPFTDNETGALWIFTRSNGTWTQKGGKLNIPTGGFKRQGNSLALSADGKTAIIGAPDSHTYTGAAGILVVGSATPAKITAFSPTSGSVGTLVTITGTNLNNPIEFTIGGKPAVIISNTGTKLVGMVMPGAVNGSIVLNTNNGVAKSQGTFAVSPTPYPGKQQGGALVGTGNTGAAKQGTSVAVSADGNTAIVGGYSDNTQVGAAWIFTRAGGVWSQQGTKLTGTGATGPAQQGTSVAMSADGNTAMIGAPGDNAGRGAVWVFTRNGNSWIQQGAKLSVAGTGPLRLGSSLSITADGNTIAAGAPGADDYLGAIYIFKRNNNTWTQSALVKAPFTVNDSYGTAGLGHAVAISADGKTLLGGAPSFVSMGGSAWVFALTGDIWVKQASLFGGGGYSPGRQGSSVSLSADGNTAAVGGALAGSVWIYKRTGTAWQQQGSPLTGAEAFGNGGWSTSLSADGNTIAFGAPDVASGNGATWIYTRSGEAWVAQGGKLANTNAVYKGQGTSVALSADGATLIAGAPTSNSNQGAAFVYEPTSLQRQQSIAFNAPDSVMYGTPDITLNATASSGLPIRYRIPPNVYSATLTGNKLQIKGAGSVTITAFQDGNDEYAAAIPLNVTIVIKKAPLTIQVSDGFTIQGYLFNNFRATYTGLVNGDTPEKFGKPRYSTVHYSTPVGTYPITASGQLSNYEVTYKPGTLTIVSHQAAQYSPVKTYGDADYYFYGADVPGLVYYSNNPAVATTVNQKIHITGAGYTNIHIGNGTQTFVEPILVNKAHLTATAQNQTKVAGEPMPPLSMILSGFVYSDNPGNLTQRPKVTTTATAASPPGTYPILVSGGVSQNYEFTYVAGTLTVTPAALGLNAAAPVSVNKAISANGDGINDVLTVNGLENFAENKLTLINAKGVKVFEAKNYGKDGKVFDGRSNITNARQQAGTYFYLLQYNDNGVTKEQKGYVTLKY